MECRSPAGAGRPPHQNETGCLQSLPDHARTVDREKEAVALGLVSNRYVPLQNIEAFSFFEPFIHNGWAQFHTAGALGNGERVWVLAKLDGQIVIGKDDAIDRYLLLSNKHDGTGAVSIRFTPIRVVCQNTLNGPKKVVPR